MSETTPEPTEPDTEPDETADDVEDEDVEPLADDQMTTQQPDQGRAQDDPSLGAPPEVDDDA